MEDRAAESKTSAENVPEFFAEDAAEDEDYFPRPKSSRIIILMGWTLTTISGVMSFCSLVSMIQLILTSSAEVMFGYEDFYLSKLKFTPMTVAFLLIAIWCVVLSPAVLILNLVFMYLVHVGKYHDVRRLAMKNALLNAIGTNATLVIATLAIFGCDHAVLSGNSGISLLVAGLIQASFSMALFAYCRGLDLEFVILAKERSIRERERLPDRPSKFKKRKKDTFNLA